VKPPEWKFLKSLIADQRIDIPLELVQAEQDSGIFDPKNKRDARKRILTSIVRRQGQPEFREKLLRIYNGKCLISGCDAEEALEAAHICPYRGDHTNHPNNGLLLRSDLHTLFDLYLISIDASLERLRIAPALRQTCYVKLGGQRVRFPRNKPSAAALDEHRAEFDKRAKGS
jgi:predicted restriction endonuclease